MKCLFVCLFICLWFVNSIVSDSACLVSNDLMLVSKLLVEFGRKDLWPNLTF